MPPINKALSHLVRGYQLTLPPFLGPSAGLYQAVLNMPASVLKCMGQSKVSLKSVGAFYAATPGQPAATTRPLKRLPKNHLLPR